MAKRKAKPKRPTLRSLQAQVTQLLANEQTLYVELMRVRAELSYAVAQVEKAKSLLVEQEPEPIDTFNMGANVGNALNSHEQRIAALEFIMRGR